MKGVLSVLGAASAAAVLAFPGVATAAAHTPFTDVPASFWAGSQIRWTVKQGWMSPRTATSFGVGHTVSRLTAARVLADVNFQQTGTPVAADPYAQAVAAGWIGRRHRRRPADHAAAVRPRRRARAESRGGRKDAEHPAHLDQLAPPAARRLRRRTDGARGRCTGQRSRRLRQVGALAERHAAARQPGLRGLPARAPVLLGRPGSRGQDGRGERHAHVDAAQAGRARIRAALRRRALCVGRHLPGSAGRVRPERGGRVRLLGVRLVGHEDADLHRRRQHLERREGHRPPAHDL